MWSRIKLKLLKSFLYTSKDKVKNFLLHLPELKSGVWTIKDIYVKVLNPEHSTHTRSTVGKTLLDKEYFRLKCIPTIHKRSWSASAVSTTFTFRPTAP